MRVEELKPKPKTARLGTWTVNNESICWRTGLVLVDIYDWGWKVVNLNINIDLDDPAVPIKDNVVGHSNWEWA